MNMNCILHNPDAGHKSFSDVYYISFIYSLFRYLYQHIPLQVSTNLL